MAVICFGRHNSFVAHTAANTGIQCIFYGDSITEWWAVEGLPVFNRYYAAHGVANYGLAGDQTQNLIWRIRNGEVAGLNPKLVVLKIGTNNLASASVEDFAQGILTIIQTLHAGLPNTRIMLVSLLPRNGVANFDKITAINSIIARYDNGHNVWYLNIFGYFSSDWGTVRDNLFTNGLHLSEAGYARWALMMNPLFDRLMEMPLLGTQVK